VPFTGLSSNNVSADGRVAVAERFVAWKSANCRTRLITECLRGCEVEVLVSCAMKD
jgi:hypothetical protein